MSAAPPDVLESDGRILAALARVASLTDFYTTMNGGWSPQAALVFTTCIMPAIRIIPAGFVIGYWVVHKRPTKAVIIYGRVP